MKDDIDFEWDIYHDMQNRDYNDILEIEKLKKQVKQLNTENELHKSWVFHHQKSVQLGREREHKFKGVLLSIKNTITKELL